MTCAVFRPIRGARGSANREPDDYSCVTSGTASDIEPPMFRRGARADTAVPTTPHEPRTLVFRVDPRLAEAAEAAASARGMLLEEWLHSLVVDATQARRRGPRNVRLSSKTVF